MFPLINLPAQATRKISLALHVLFSLVFLGACSTWPAPLAHSTSGCQWRLVFGDDFTEATLNTQKWEYVYGSGGNGEQQYYAPDAFEFQDGVLKIRADRRQHGDYPYTSGIIHTWNTFQQQYGYFKLRAKLPKGQGLWPAFWLLPVSKNYPIEIDILEVLGHQPNVVNMTHHFADDEGEHRQRKYKYTGVDYSADFHTFAVIWTPQEITWYIDDQKYFRSNLSIPAEPMFLLANLAVGGRWPGNPDETTPFPSYYEIDYIEVYAQECLTN